MRYFTCAALLALMVLVGCDDSGGSNGGGGQAPLSITTPLLAGPLQGAFYSAPISATGGSGGYTWSIVAGALPAGFSLTPTGTPDASLAGVTTATGAFNFTVQVTDSSAATATMACTLFVTATSTPPSYFNQAVGGRVLFICDISSATAGQPMVNLQTELSAALASMSSSDEFDIMVFNSAISGYVSTMWGAPMPATSSNVAAATAWINGSNFTPAGSPDNACYAALQESFAAYADMDNAYLWTWTTPSDASNILADYPAWAASDPNRQLTVICNGGSAHTFGQQLAALAGGTYVP